MRFEGWKMQTLKDVCIKIGSGATPTGGSSAYESSGTTLIRSQNVLDFSFSKGGLAYINDIQAKKLNGVTVEKGDILLNITGDSVARACIVPSNILPARVNQHVAIIRVDRKKVDNRFLFYHLEKMKTFLLSSAGIGCTRNALTKSMIESIEILLPQLSEQKAIACILSSLDDKIELNNRMNKTLEEIAQTLFKRWFVDFEFPDVNGNPYKSSGGKMIESDLGLIPEGWKTSRLENLCIKITKGTTPTTMKRQYTQSGINFVKAESITDAHLFEKGKFAFIDNETNHMLQRSIVEANDLLFTIAGTIGRFALATANILPANTNQAVAIIRVNKEKLHPSYLLCLFLCGQHTQFLESKVVHAVQANLSLGIISSLPIIVPEGSTHNIFIDLISPVLTRLFVNYHENESLTQIRDSLLPKLMSGEIRVPIAEE